MSNLWERNQADTIVLDQHKANAQFRASLLWFCADEGITLEQLAERASVEPAKVQRFCLEQQDGCLSFHEMEQLLRALHGHQLRRIRVTVDPATLDWTALAPDQLDEAEHQQYQDEQQKMLQLYLGSIDNPVKLIHLTVDGKPWYEAVKQFCERHDIWHHRQECPMCRAETKEPEA